MMKETLALIPVQSISVVVGRYYDGADYSVSINHNLEKRLHRYARMYSWSTGPILSGIRSKKIALQMAVKIARLATGSASSKEIVASLAGSSLLCASERTIEWKRARVSTIKDAIRFQTYLSGEKHELVQRLKKLLGSRVAEEKFARRR